MANTDIKSLPEDGYLVIPLSMSRLTTPSQGPKACYSTLEHLADKCEKLSNDVILLYTSGLYFNTKDPAYEVRRKVVNQLIAHRNGMDKIIKEKKRFIPNAFHYLTFDYIIANTDRFQKFFDSILSEYQNNEIFQEIIHENLNNRERNEANIRFLLEETAVSHIIREKFVELPRTLVKKDLWRLIAYPNPSTEIDAYIWKQGILPKNQNDDNPFSNGVYDSEQKVFIEF